MDLPYALQDTIISPATNAGPRVTEYSAFAFDCALSGPFNKPFTALFPATRALCEFVSCFYLRFNGLVIQLLSPLYQNNFVCQHKKLNHFNLFRRFSTKKVYNVQKIVCFS